MRTFLFLAGTCLAISGTAQQPDKAAQRVDHVAGFIVDNHPPQPHLPTDPGMAVPQGPDSLLVVSPALGTVRARLAVKPSARWADDGILDDSEQEIGGCDRVLMGLFFTTSAGNTELMEWRYSRFDATSLLTTYGVGDAVHEGRWGPEASAVLDLERTVPFTVRPHASIELTCAFDAEDRDLCIVVYAAGPHQATHEVYRSKADGPLSFRTANTGEEPLHFLVTAWTRNAQWQQNRIMNTSKDIRVQGLKYYEFDFDGWNTVEEVAARISVQLRKEP